MDQVSVQENQTVVTVKDQDNLPVTLTNTTIGVSGGDQSISVVSKSGDAITVQDSEGVLQISDTKNVIQPQYREVFQITKEVPSEEEMYKEEVDFVGDSLVYRGWAVPGAASSAPAWRIRRTRFIGAEGDVAHDWADGNANFDNIWDDRASLTYN